MNDQTLILDAPAPRDVAVAHDEPPSNDLRHAMMTLPVERQNKFLAIYKERRDNFRSWLMSQLVEGTHYGIVPGCEPKMEMRKVGGKGEPVPHYGVWNKKKDGGKGGYDFHPETQWRPKPSLYAAGADFICDVCGVRDEYESDLVAWQQMGSKAGNAVVKCRLFSRANRELIGESLGAYYHQYDPNNALKMASKCAKVGAVINAYDLRDLFTQDDPNDRPPPNDNPPENPEAPKEQPRAKREQPPAAAISEQDLAHLIDHWKAANPEPDGNLVRQGAAFKTWAMKIGDRVFNPRKLSEWTVNDYVKCCAALSIPTLEELRK